MTTLIMDLASVTVVAAVTGIIARRLNQPSILGYLFAGLLVGPYLPLPLFADTQRITELAEVGVVLVMFAVGLEFRIQNLLKILPISGFTAAIEITLLIWVGYRLGMAMGWSPAAAVCLGTTLAISSTMVVSAVLKNQPVDPEIRAHVFGVLVIQDVAAIALMAVVTALAAGQTVGTAAVARLMGQLIVVVGVMLAVGLLILPRLVRYTLRVLDEEALVVLMAGAAFGFSLLAHAFGYSVALGAFIAGMAVAESRRHGQVKRVIEPLRALFAAIFFVSIGMTVDPRAAWSSLPLALLLSLVVVVVQFISVSAASVLSGSSLKQGIFAGLALGQVGELSFILASIAIGGGLMEPSTLAALVTVSTLTAFTTPLFLRWAPGVVRVLDRALPDRLHQALTMHQAFVRRLQRPSESGPSLRKPALGLALDWGALMALLALRVKLQPYVPESWQIVFDAGIVVFAAPFLVALVMAARSLLSAVRVLAKESLGAAAGAAESLSFILIILMIGAPTLALMRPIIDSGWVEAGLLGVLFLASVVTLLRVRNLKGEYQSQVSRIAVGFTHGVVGEDTMDVPAVPSFDDMEVEMIAINEGSAAAGKTLADLNLRAETGATVVAIQHADSTTVLPTGHEPLVVGDRVGISGTPDAVRQARVVLTRRAPAEVNTQTLEIPGPAI